MSNRASKSTDGYSIAFKFVKILLAVSIFLLLLDCALTVYAVSFSTGFSEKSVLGYPTEVYYLLGIAGAIALGNVLIFKIPNKLLKLMVLASSLTFIMVTWTIPEIPNIVGNFMVLFHVA